MKVHYPKLYNMAHLLTLNVLLFPKDLTIIFISFTAIGDPIILGSFYNLRTAAIFILFVFAFLFILFII